MMPTVPLGDGLMPALGLGMFGIPSGSCSERAVVWALACGYRHIDTAPGYRNEGDVAAAVRDARLPREAIFITTKVPPEAVHPGQVRAELEQSLRRLNLDRVDLCLLHRPAPRHVALWEAMCMLKREGWCRFAGISNVSERHLVEIDEQGLPLPDAIQVEIHPFLPQPELRRWCVHKQVCVIGYSPLARGARLEHPMVLRIAHELGRTPAQILLRWGLDCGHAIVVGSMNQRHIEENRAALEFKLPVEHRALLDRIDERLRVSWYPNEPEPFDS